MNYYLRVVGQGHADQVWRIDEHDAVRLGIGNPESGPGSHFKPAQDETIWDAIERQTGWLKAQEPETSPFHKLELGPREYYPRIARPLSFTKQAPSVSPSAMEERNIVALGRGQANALMRHLNLICQTVHPSAETFGTFGHEIRNLLILAATEVEAHWRGVLVANGSKKDQFSTRDYVRLLGPMRLDDYAVSFSSYPWLPPITPFAGWDADRPTKSLRWYDAYNQVKHDRERAFAQASLEHAFNAVTACIIMLAAQFTRSTGLGDQSDLIEFFIFTAVPRWTAGEIYCHFAEEKRNWTAVFHPDLAPSLELQAFQSGGQNTRCTG